jgi:hypothetical protein
MALSIGATGDVNRAETRRVTCTDGSGSSDSTIFATGRETTTAPSIRLEFAASSRADAERYIGHANSYQIVIDSRERDIPLVSPSDAKATQTVYDNTVLIFAPQ